MAVWLKYIRQINIQVIIVCCKLFWLFKCPPTPLWLPHANIAKYTVCHSVILIFREKSLGENWDWRVNFPFCCNNLGCLDAFIWFDMSNITNIDSITYRKYCLIRYFLWCHSRADHNYSLLYVHVFLTNLLSLFAHHILPCNQTYL